MKLELRHTFESGLPPDDDHPYRSGLWKPQENEYDAWDLDVIGEIPDDLNGVYVRNTENPLLEPIRRCHPFDGDGVASRDLVRERGGPLCKPIRANSGVSRRAGTAHEPLGRAHRTPE